MDDSELLAAIRRADPSAATAFHDRVRPQVDRTLVRLLGRQDADHDDLAQLAMMELMSSLHRYRGDCSLDTWTSTITARVAYKHIRRKQSERRVFGTSAVDDEFAPSPRSLETDAVARSLVERVRVHLDAMGDDKAWTFWLHDVCGYELGEIAQMTHASLTAAQSRLVRGRRELHERIASDPELAGILEKMESGS
jgi:RNA polymerase sigma-70 factor (ECF subfamily)